MACVWTVVYLRSDKSSAPVKVYEVPQQTLQGQSNTESAIRQDTQRVETSERQVPETDESSVESETYLTGDFLGTVVAETTEESKEVESDALDMETSSATPQLSAEESRRQTLINRQVEIQEQLEAMAREDGTVAPKDVPKSLALFEETLRISQELGTLDPDDSSDAFSLIERSKFIASHTTEDGKVPISIGSRVADMFEKDGNYEAAEKMRMLTQYALESGDEFFTARHLEILQ